MKALKLSVCLSGLFISSALFAQTPKAVEADLNKSFKKIDYWFEKERDTTFDITIASDSLEKTNTIFGKKLLHYTSTCPFTIHQDFTHLTINIVSSADERLRIYSWDTRLGGTMVNYNNVIQYKIGANVQSTLLDNVSVDNGYVYYYSKLFTLSTKNKIYYLAVYNGKFSSKDMREGIKVFAIEDGKLNDNVNIIETMSGLHNKLYFDYDLFTIADKIKDPDITYDPSSKTISIPVISGHGRVTNARILYKFTGKYFEKI
jgi:hypothetical protein